MQDRDRSPALTVALLTPNDFSAIQRTVSLIAAQDVAPAIELLILAPDPHSLQLQQNVVRDFHSVRVVKTGFSIGSGAARASAIREASAPVVAFGEDHCFPDAGWAAALLNAHKGPWTAVGPVMRNANPASLASWAGFLMGYGPWLAPGLSRERDHLPGHNTSYKREALLQLNGDLAALMEAETLLQWRLRAEGHRLYQESRACVAHTNFERWRTLLYVSFHAGRVFAATRSLDWSLARRWAFALATPLVPAVRLLRHLGQAASAGLPKGLIARVAPALVLSLLVDAAGQCLGCLAGAGNSRRTLVDWEFYRNEPRRPADRTVS